MSKKNCAFQFAITHGEIRTAGLYMSGHPKIIEDTGLITLEEAKKLWNKYLPEFKQAMKDENPAQMCIWSEMGDITDYHTALYDLDTRDDIKLNDSDDIVLVKEQTVGEL